MKSDRSGRPSALEALRAAIERQLEDLRDRGLHRSLHIPSGIDFASNDYLGLANLPELRRRLIAAVERAGPAAPASRLLRGNLAEHLKLETRLAAYKGCEAALLFSSGYQANLALVGALMGPGDRVLSDELNHASLIDALRLARPTRIIFPHLDVSRLEDELARPHHGGATFIVTESLFSMDGDIAPLDAYADLADRHGAVLIVDDAHATGVFGDERGSGLAERFAVARRAGGIMSTFGKALGFSGAFVAGPRWLIDWMVNHARPFIYTTAQPPLLLAAIETALDCAMSRPDLRRRVLELAARLRSSAREAGLDVLGQEGPIVPVVIGQNERTLRVAARLRERGFDVRAIRPPSVPEGTARLRICVHADHEAAQIDDLVAALADSVRSVR